MAQPISLLNTVIGPVMRGPSSSHSAAPFLIGRTVRQLSLLPGDALSGVTVRFDPHGSFAAVYRNQGSDEGFAAGLAGVDMTSDAYRKVLLESPISRGFELTFEVAPLRRNEHPNRVELDVTVRQQNNTERFDHYEAVSLGGGTFQVTHCNGNTTSIDGNAFTLIVEHSLDDASTLMQWVGANCAVSSQTLSPGWLGFSLTDAPGEAVLTQLRDFDGVTCARVAKPVQEIVQGDADRLLEMLSLTAVTATGDDLAQYALAYESALLGQSQTQIAAHFQERLELLATTVELGLRDGAGAGMRHLQPSARALADATLPAVMDGGFLKAAMTGALATMEQSATRGVVCAAPTAGSAGIVPGALHGLRALGATDAELRKSLQVMSLVGAVFAARGSFAAETGGCSVETGASAAMASAGITYHFGGNASQVLTAASLCLMNTLGLVCDPVGGDVEIPCHARNIAGIGHAWTASIAALAGFNAVIPFDELVEQTVKIGEHMHPDLRCTARGGCAVTPTSIQLTQRPER